MLLRKALEKSVWGEQQSMPNRATVDSWLSEFLAAINPDRGVPAPTANLYEAGLLDSLGIVLLITDIEKRFSIVLSPDALSEESFESMEAISALILREAKLKQGA